MINIKNKTDSRYCNCCAQNSVNLKEIEFRKKFGCGLSISLCKECRDELLRKLTEENFKEN